MGFCDEVRAEAAKGHSSGNLSLKQGTSADVDTTAIKAGENASKQVYAGSGVERKGWIRLEGTVRPNGKPVAAVGEAQLKILRAAGQEVRRKKLVCTCVTVFHGDPTLLRSRLRPSLTTTCRRLHSTLNFGKMSGALDRYHQRCREVIFRARVPFERGSVCYLKQLFRGDASATKIVLQRA